MHRLLLTSLKRAPRVGALAAGAALTLGVARAEAAPSSDMTEEGLGPVQGLPAPPPFSDLEDSKDHSVQEFNGLNLSINPGTADGRARFTWTAQITPTSASTPNWAVAVESDPSVSAAYQRGQEGRILILSSSKKLETGKATLEVQAAQNQLYGAKLTYKHNGEDFTGAASVSHSGRGGDAVELTYFQAVTAALSLGGSVSGTFPSLLTTKVPSLVDLSYGVNGALALGPQGKRMLLGKWSPREGLGLRYWAEPTKGLELSAATTVSAEDMGVSTVLGAKMTMAADAGAGGVPPPTLSLNVHLPSGKTAVGYQVHSQALTDGTYCLIALSAAMEHPMQDYKVGGNVAFYF